MYNIEERLVPAGVGIRRTGYTMKPRGVVWHSTGNYDAGADATMHQRWWSNPACEVGAHYVVDQDQILHTAPNTEVIWHAGPGGDTIPSILIRYPKYPNFETIGVEMCVNTGNSFPETYKRSVYLGAVLCIDNGWTPYQNFDRHYDCTHKECPEMWWGEDNQNWKQFLWDVTLMIKELTAPKAPEQIFADVPPGQWFTADIEQAFYRGLFKGSKHDDGKLYAEVGQPITVERAAVLINRAVTYIVNKAGIKE